MSFKWLVRYADSSGNIHFGDLKQAPGSGSLEGAEVEVLNGDLHSEFSRAGKTDKIHKLLCPLPGVPIVMCVGLNYRQHAAEANLKLASNPVIFTKPPDALAGPYEDVPVHPECQSHLDYEGELTVVIGKDAKNVSEADALNYVLGYTVGNDVSARNFQMPDVSGGQHGYAKSFDKFAPIGPCITSAELIPDPQKLHYTTKVNGELRQETETSDMIWTVRQIIAHLSRGTTLRKGTAIQTGTPSGVGLFMEPKGFVKNGDVVEITVDGIGSIRNKMVFE
ncbi:hypothetical protein NA57DRAFT_65709 [Rhizodiscina lignyota]|uniref:Fumarylacetoacetase-like C-terminal domain-containing protein n=1 Tax=Rhizodiscina lignyota TaxID=1504668 RepID=A0A9P4M6Y5_9PEZI|nr:hypothetical protein NA57DRAFT_65709 [Rhizodiscina lignyota]